MRFHIVVIKIRSELAEIEFEKKSLQFFNLCVVSLLSTLHVPYKAFYDSQNSPKIQFFKSRFYRLKRLESQFNVDNRLIRTQMTSQIAGIGILHILGTENPYMKSVQNPGFMYYPYIPTWLLASYKSH